MELVIIAALAQLLVGSILVSRWLYWKEKAAEASAAYGDIADRAQRAEKDADSARDELNRWQQMLASMNTRPIIATLNDQQTAALISSIQMFIQSNMAGPN